MKHFLDIADLSSAELRTILEVAKREKQNPKHQNSFAGKTLAMLFEKSSTRTRISFQVGMQQLGGQALVLDSRDLQLGRGETFADTAKVLSRYCDLIMLRTDAHDKLNEIAKSASIPVINGLSDDSHPCQILADIQTIEEQRGAISDQHVVWVGDGNNVANSLAHAAVKLGFDFTVITPKAYQMSQKMQLWLKDHDNAGRVKQSEQLSAIAGADVVVTDTWVSMGDESEQEQRLRDLMPYQVNADLMKQAKADAVFLHCLPAHRGEEVSADVIDGKQSLVFDEAENRVHAQKAIMLWCLDLI